MIINFADLSPNRIYYTMTQTLLPRPIAWVLSDNGGDSDDGARYNLAPFSYFNGVSSDPPLIMLSIGKKTDGSVKDTRHNILERHHFVVHIPHREQAAAVAESSREFPFGVSEQQTLQLPTVPFGDFSLPRLANSRVAFACECYQILEFGPLPQAMILGLVKAVYIDDAIADVGDHGRLHVDPVKFDALARIGGSSFCTLGEVIEYKLK